MGMTWTFGLERLVESCQADNKRGYLVGEKGVWEWAGAGRSVASGKALC